MPHVQPSIADESRPETMEVYGAGQFHFPRLERIMEWKLIHARARRDPSLRTPFAAGIRSTLSRRCCPR
jgi:hypothetical protein